MLTFKKDNGFLKSIDTLILKETKTGKLTIDHIEDYPALKLITKEVLGESRLYITSEEYDKILLDDRYELTYEIIEYPDNVTLILTREEFNALSQLVWCYMQDYEPEKDKFGHPRRYDSPFSSDRKHLSYVKKKMEKFQIG